MRFYADRFDLEYFNRFPDLECYYDAVFAPSDIMLQANGYVSLTDTFTIQINVCDLSGAVVEDATANFVYNFRSITIAGVVYYYCNIMCDTYSAYMSANRCFTLNVTIFDGTTTVFNQWTQQYKIVVESSTYVAPTVLQDGVLLEPCVPPDNPALCIPDTGGYMLFETSFDCADTFSGDIYAEGDIMSAVGEPFLYRRFSHILSRLRKAPNEIVRIVSRNCRTQKTQIKPSLEYFANIHFPEWKMEDVEGMFLGNKLYIDGVQYENDGGIYFEQLGTAKECQFIYKFSAIMHKCLQWQIFGCVPNCDALASYYLFPDAFERLYDDALRLIATTPEQLLTYFESIPDTTATELSFYLPCQYDTVVKVQSSGVLPKFIYVDEPTPSQRVYPKQLSANTSDLSALCNGVTNNNQVPVPDITGYESEDINIPVPNITGYDSVSANIETIVVTAGQGWTVQGAFTSATNFNGYGVLNLSLSTNTISPYINEVIATISVEGRPTGDILVVPTDNGNMPPASTLIIGADGTITYTGSATNQIGNDYYVELFMIRYLL